MDRLFKEHNLRKTFSLDGNWKFVARDGEGLENKIPEDVIDMYVPSCWNLRMGLLDYQQVAWYYREFETNCENILLSFGAVSGRADVYLDGEFVGSHIGGYTEFSFNIKTVKDCHLLAVKVDASSSDVTIPKTIADWYRYGGIYRSVELAEIKDNYISRHKIGYDLKGSDASVTVETEVKGKTPEKLTVKFAGETVYCGDYEKVISFEVKNILLWEFGSPNLYFVEIIVDGDDIIDRIGFRTVEAKNNKIYINNKEVELKGVNRHEDHPDFGHALPKSVMERDIDIIKDMGCNTVRGSHYPHSRAFMDYLDQNGIYFWSEIPLWGAAAETLEDSSLIECGCNMHKEMVEQYYNHPSIIIWGLHNEIDTRVQSGRNLTEKFLKIIKDYDSKRPTTFATMYLEEDICLDLADIISINKYIGWYGGKWDEWYDFMQIVSDRMKEEKLADKPVIMSEFGAAGLYGYHTFDNVRWTEEYQANLITFELELFKKYPYICGTYVWHFADARTSKDSIDRARCFNNKGLLNEHRRPKLALSAVKKFYKG